MTDAWKIGDSDVLRYVIKHELKDHGVKINKLKGAMRTNSSAPTQVQLPDIDAFIPLFGVSLTHIPSCKDLQTGLEIPRLIQDCVQFLAKHLDEEGLFRKSGSHTRQKELQNNLSHGDTISDNTQVADVAGIFKRFLRELPEPIIPARVQSSLVKCVSLEDEILQEWTSLLLLCLLPARELQLLRYMMLFLAKVASNSENNKMNTKNLARVLMPAVFGADGSGSKTTQIERQIKLQTLAVEIMINNAKDIGLVPDYILDRMVKTKSRSTEGLDNILSDDDLERGSDDNLDQNVRTRRKKRQSGTFQGIVNGLGQVSQKVGELLKPAGSLDNLDKTPDEINPGETPRNLRSSKRKASDDIGSVFSATKRSTPSPVRSSLLRRSLRTRRKSSSPIRRRKAMLRQMVADPQYSKRGVHLHKSNPSSPMTPLQSAKPALGEIDAVAPDGKTLFHFNTPSIKFADDSFSGFTSSPSSSVTADSLPPGATPRRNKLKKLNPLNSRRFKRLSLGTIGGSSRTATPLKPHQRQNNKCGTNCERCGENVGLRLANQPFPEGLDSLRLIPRDPECRETFGYTATGKTKEDVSATTYTPPPYLKKNTVKGQRSSSVKERAVTSSTASEGTVVTSNKNTHNAVRHKVEGWVHDGEMGSYQTTDWTADNDKDRASSVSIDDPSSFSMLEFYETGKVDHQHLLDEAGMGQKDNERVVPEPLILESRALTMSDDEIGDMKGNQSTNVVREFGHQRSSSHSLQYSDSQKSLSSILSSVTVQSTKSYFSVEAEQETEVEPSPPTVHLKRDIPLRDQSSSPDEERDSTYDAGSEKAESEPVISSVHKISGSLCSLDATPSKNKTAEWILKKTISVDSGRGESVEDLQPMQDDTDFDLTSRQLPASMGDFDNTQCSHLEQKFPETSNFEDRGQTLTLQPVLSPGCNFSKVNPSKLKPLKVDHDDSSLKKFHIMQKRLNSGSREEYKSVKQKIRMFNSLSHDDIRRECGIRPVSHRSGSSLPGGFYEKKSSPSSSRKQERLHSDIEPVSLSPLVKSVSYDSGLKELTKQTSEEEPKTPPSNGMGSKFNLEEVHDSYEAVMNSAKKALSNFQRIAETCTPMSQCKPLADRNTRRDYPVMQSLLEDHNPLSPQKNDVVKSPSIKKQLKRLNSENSPSWQRASPKGSPRPGHYMHLLKSPKGSHGSPQNPLFVTDRRGGRRRSNARKVRTEWQV